MRLCNITEKGRMVAQSGIITAMCNRYSVDITPVTHVISQGCNIHAHDIPVGTVILHPVPYTIVPGPGRGAWGGLRVRSKWGSESGACQQAWCSGQRVGFGARGWGGVGWGGGGTVSAPYTFAGVSKTPP